MTHIIRSRPLAVTAALLLAAPAAAQQVESRKVNTTTAFSLPVFGTSAPGRPDTLYIVQQGGLIRELNTTTGAVGPTFLNLPTAVGGGNFLSGGEQGLLGLAFHLNYAAPVTEPGSGRFYVYYTTPGVTEPNAVRVDEFRATNGVVDTGSRRNIIQFDTPKNPGSTNHNAGWIGFNPVNGATGTNSGNLYIMTGDSGGGGDPLNVAQNTNTLQGKVLRIDVNSPSGDNNYGIPAGNMTGVNVRPELFAYGLRNPYRASFDRQTGDLYIGDVGQSAREEIDFIANGAVGGFNFGWDRREGRLGETGFGETDPIYDYGRSIGRSVTGGYVYRGENAALRGTYIFGDYVDDKVFAFRYTGTDIPTDTATDLTSQLRDAVNGGRLENVSSFAEDGFGNLYVFDLIGGEVFQIVPVPEPMSVGLVAGGVVAVVAGWRRARRRAG